MCPLTLYCADYNRPPLMVQIKTNNWNSKECTWQTFCKYLSRDIRKITNKTPVQIGTKSSIGQTVTCINDHLGEHAHNLNTNDEAPLTTHWKTANVSHTFEKPQFCAKAKIRGPRKWWNLRAPKWKSVTAQDVSGAVLWKFLRWSLLSLLRHWSWRVGH